MPLKNLQMNEAKVQNIWQSYRDSGLHIFPTLNKIPSIQKGTSWKIYSDKWQFNGSAGLACGTLSGGVEVLDVDAKNDSGLIDKLSKALLESGLQVPADFVIQTTPNGGLHFVYKTEIIEGSQILAKNKIGSVLIETRGDAGYACVSPTPGYQIKQGDFTNIPFFTNVEREKLFEVCRSLNEFWPEVKQPVKTNVNTTSEGLTPWDDYNQRGDVTELLQRHGWTFLKNIGDNEHFCRPDKKGSTSATWNESKRLFYCFTSSTIFEPGKAYNSTAVFAFLETGKNFTDAGGRLYSEGYGERSGQRQVNPRPEKTNDWRALQILTEPDEETPLLSIGGAPIATSGNYSQIIGKKKSRKSLFLTYLVSQYAGNPADDVILFDTEQGTRHVWKAMDRIKRLTGYQVGTFYLRGKSPAERKAIIETVVREYPTRPKLIIIDGIRDLLSNINDPDQVSELLTWLEKLTLENSLHVINVLHMNKTDNNARGHLGSELLNKSEVTIELERDEKADCTLVKCESSRDIPFEGFAFRHDVNGLPEVVGMPTDGRVLPEVEKRARLIFLFNEAGGMMRYTELVEGIKTHFVIGINKAKNLLAEFSRSGWIVKSGIERSKDVTYKLMISVV